MKYVLFCTMFTECALLITPPKKVHFSLYFRGVELPRKCENSEIAFIALDVFFTSTNSPIIWNI